MAEVPDVSHRGSTGGSDAESLMRSRQVAPSGMVPQPPQEDVTSSLLLSVSVASGNSVSVPGPLPPLLGQVGAPVDWMHDQSRVRGATGVKFDNVSAHVANVSFALSVSASSFDPSALLFPSSALGFSSRDFPGFPASSSAPSLPLPFSVPPPLSSLTPSAPSVSVPIFSLSSVVPSVLSSSSVTSFSAPPAPLPSLPFSAPPSHPPSFSVFAPSLSAPRAPPPGLSAPSLVSFPSSSSSPTFRLPLLGWSLPLLLSLLRPLLRGSLQLLLLPLLLLGILQCKARVLGLSAEYQALGRWFVSSGVPISLRTFLLTSLIFTLIFVLTFLLALPVFFRLWPRLLLSLLLPLLLLSRCRLLFLPFLRLRFFSLLLLCLLLLVLLLRCLLPCLRLRFSEFLRLLFLRSLLLLLFIFLLGVVPVLLRVRVRWLPLFLCLFFFFSFPPFCCGFFSSGSFSLVFAFRLFRPFFFCLCSVCSSSFLCYCG